MLLNVLSTNTDCSKNRWKKSSVRTRSKDWQERSYCALNHIRLHTGWWDLAHLRRWLIRQLSSQRIPLMSPWVTDSVCRTNPAGVSVRWSRSGSCGVEPWSVISSLSAWLCAVVVFTFIFHFAYERVERGGKAACVCVYPVHQRTHLYPSSPRRPTSQVVSTRRH